MKKSNKPTEAELEILQVLWKNEPSTVRFVNEELNKKRRIGYTTTLKIMQLMFSKDMLERVEAGRKHLYTSIIKEKETQNVLLDKFLNTTFGGSAMKLVMQALGNHSTSKDELDQIKDLIESIEKQLIPPSPMKVFLLFRFCYFLHTSLADFTDSSTFRADSSIASGVASLPSSRDFPDSSASFVLSSALFVSSLSSLMAPARERVPLPKWALKSKPKK